MITRSGEGKECSFEGGSFDLLATDDRVMVTRMRFVESDDVPFHEHPQAQAGYVISGRYRFCTRGAADAGISGGDVWMSWARSTIRPFCVNIALQLR